MSYNADVASGEPSGIPGRRMYKFVPVESRFIALLPHRAESQDELVIYIDRSARYPRPAETSLTKDRFSTAIVSLYEWE